MKYVRPDGCDVGTRKSCDRPVGLHDHGARAEEIVDALGDEEDGRT
jgi:hypothetical protein